MRLWSWQLIPYLNYAQFRGQLRELTAIMRDWRDKGATNHLLINKVMEYPKSDLEEYFNLYKREYHKRYGRWLLKLELEFLDFASEDNCKKTNIIFEGWHNKEYLRVCMANLYEKHHFGIGKSRITDEEWQVLLDGYKAITGEEYKI